METKLQLPYDVCIVGGGLAGLSLSILLAKKKMSVLLIEKNTYPHHKVCGEYISLESWDFLQRLGVPLSDMQLPIICQLKLTSVLNTSLNMALPLGGFGISRYKLDYELYLQAISCGVNVWTSTTMFKYSKENDNYKIESSKGTIVSKLLISAIGKHSLKPFTQQAATKNEYIGIKYHLKYNNSINEIALHAFEGGYAGISAIENNTTCFCYLVKASLLKQYKGDIKLLEQNIMSKNIHIKKILQEGNFLWQQPEVISNIYFGKKAIVFNDVLYLGDSAGAIPPLCGNGMSMALRSAYLLAPLVHNYLQGSLSKSALNTQFISTWNAHFAKRIKAGMLFQELFFVKRMFNFSLKFLHYMPWLHKPIIRLTHGKSF